MGVVRESPKSLEGQPQGKIELAESVVGWREEPSSAARSGLGKRPFRATFPHIGIGVSGLLHVSTSG